MVATEIFLIAAGVICVVVSVVMSFGDDKENVENSAKAELTQAQLDMVKHQVDEVIKQQDRKSTRLNSSHRSQSRMPSSA